MSDSDSYAVPAGDVESPTSLEDLPPASDSARSQRSWHKVVELTQLARHRGLILRSGVRRWSRLAGAQVLRRIKIGMLLARRWRVSMFIAIVVAAGAALMVWLLCYRHTKPASIPPWISAAGSTATFIGVAVAVTTYRSQRRSQIEDQACQVRLLRPQPIPGPLHQGKRTWWMTVENRSDESVYDLDIMAMRAVVEEEGKAVWLRPISSTKLGSQILVTGALARASKIKPGETWEIQMAMDERQDQHIGRSVIAFQLTVVDAKGRLWLVTDHYEPEKITRPARPRYRQLRI